jgi:hypothetical protein
MNYMASRLREVSREIGEDFGSGVCYGPQIWVMSRIIRYRRLITDRKATSYSDQEGVVAVITTRGTS